MQNYPLQKPAFMANPETCPQRFQGNHFPGHSNRAIPIIIPNRIPDGYLYMGLFSKKTMKIILCIQFLVFIVEICVWFYSFHKSQKAFDGHKSNMIDKFGDFWNN